MSDVIQNVSTIIINRTIPSQNLLNPEALVEGEIVLVSNQNKLYIVNADLKLTTLTVQDILPASLGFTTLANASSDCYKFLVQTLDFTTILNTSPTVLKSLDPTRTIITKTGDTRYKSKLKCTVPRGLGLVNMPHQNNRSDYVLDNISFVNPVGDPYDMSLFRVEDIDSVATINVPHAEIFSRNRLPIYSYDNIYLIAYSADLDLRIYKNGTGDSINLTSRIQDVALYDSDPDNLTKCVSLRGIDMHGVERLRIDYPLSLITTDKFYFSLSFEFSNITIENFCDISLNHNSQTAYMSSSNFITENLYFETPYDPAYVEIKLSGFQNAIENGFTDETKVRDLDITKIKNKYAAVNFLGNDSFEFSKGIVEFVNPFETLLYGYYIGGYAFDLTNSPIQSKVTTVSLLQGNNLPINPTVAIFVTGTSTLDNPTGNLPAGRNSETVNIGVLSCHNGSAATNITEEQLKVYRNSTLQIKYMDYKLYLVLDGVETLLIDNISPDVKYINRPKLFNSGSRDVLGNIVHQYLGLPVIEYDFKDALTTSGLNVPSDVSDGIYYKSNSSFSVMGKTVKVGDYVQFQDGCTNFIVHKQ